jgi:hypothetical protein
VMDGRASQEWPFLPRVLVSRHPWRGSNTWRELRGSGPIYQDSRVRSGRRIDRRFSAGVRP